MRLSLVFELLLIFVLLAFAASKSVKNRKKNIQAIEERIDIQKPEDENSLNKYCKCSEAYCNCCRDFSVPLVKLSGPGCASLMYMKDDKMSVSLSFGKKVITNKTLSSRKPSPVCMPLPGGISKFCGRVYNIARSGEEFRACLGLELLARKSVEASVRVSCFKFGSRGVRMEPADPLPLVPQGEKDDDDDDDDDDSEDDDDDDDFGLGDDDDDALDGINDVGGADYTGFSLIGEDLLGDLFGTSSEKKPNKNRNKKKQAPAVTAATSTTTTTRRPRPSRRPSRRPSTRVSTTPKPRTTTVRIRPGNRRTTRKPGRRRTPKPTIESIALTPIITSSSIATPPTSHNEIVGSSQQTTEPIKFSSTANDDTYEPVVIVTQKPMSTMPITSSKPVAVTNFADPGLEMSLAHITGQLSSMPVTPIVPNDPKDSSATANEDSYEKIETITPKATTASFAASSEKYNDDMVQIVHSLDSGSEEQSLVKEPMIVEESRAHFHTSNSAPLEHIPAFMKATKQKQKNKSFEEYDFDVIGLSEIGETVGDHVHSLAGMNLPSVDQLGLFGRNKRQHGHKNENNHGHKKDNNDYDLLGFDALGESLGLERSKKNRRRQNKMMREWSQA